MKFTTLAIAAACVAATPAWAQEFSANEERGCALFAKLTGSSATREECRGLIASNKKNRDLLACTTAAAMARVARLNEAPTADRPT
jgi:hypothetical protein